MALKGREYLRNFLALKRSRVLLRYKYYDMKNGIKYFGHAVAVHTKHNTVTSHTFSGEISVCDTYSVTVSHFTQHLQKLRR